MEGFNGASHFIEKHHSARGSGARTLPSEGTAWSGVTLLEIGLEKKNPTFALDRGCFRLRCPYGPGSLPCMDMTYFTDSVTLQAFNKDSHSEGHGE